MRDDGFRKYLVSYNFDGSSWSFHIYARDMDDAAARVARLAWATLDGELMMTVPATVGFLLPVTVAVRNWLHRTFVR